MTKATVGFAVDRAAATVSEEQGLPPRTPPASQQESAGAKRKALAGLLGNFVAFLKADDDDASPVGNPLTLTAEGRQVCRGGGDIRTEPLGSAVATIVCVSSILSRSGGTCWLKKTALSWKSLYVISGEAGGRDQVSCPSSGVFLASPTRHSFSTLQGCFGVTFPCQGMFSREYGDEDSLLRGCGWWAYPWCVGRSESMETKIRCYGFAAGGQRRGA